MSLVYRLQKAIKHPGQAFDFLRYHGLKPFGHHNFERFILLTRSRTGSNMLISFLNSHPNIYAQGEIFRNLEGRDYKTILDEAFSKQPHYIKAAGFKIFYYHPLDDDSCDIWSDLVNMQGLCVIHLKRKNILRTLISRKIAGMQKVWTATGSDVSGKTGTKTVEFTVEELEQGFEQTRRWEKEADQMFSEHQKLNIDYEDLVKNPESEFARVTDLLGLRYTRPHTDLKRQNPEKISKLVVNYQALKATFAGTEWEPFFKD